MINLETEIQYLKGVGPKKAASFLKLGVKTISDLLVFFPSYYQDRTQIIPIQKVLIQGDKNCIFGRVGKTYQKNINANLVMLDIEIIDETGKIYSRFFRKKNAYSKFDAFASLKKNFTSGRYAYIYGSVKSERMDIYIAPDDYEIVDDRSKEPMLFKKLLPVYPASEGLSQKLIRDCIETALSSCKNLYPDISSIIPRLDNITNEPSPLLLTKMHSPSSLFEAEQARRSFAMQEFLILETALFLSRSKNKILPKVQKYEISKNLLTPFKNNLKFSFTRAQKKVINEIFSDMQNPYQMNRLLMGDVGSGKTVTALSAMLLAAENKYQSTLIAPTEILAEQHFSNISKMLEGLPVKIALLTSNSLKRKTEREIKLKEIADGSIDIVIGTHSIIEERIKFKSLALVAVDEQHRFGVMQKLAALKKAQSPDVLMMTATPIPRALSMTVYGDMDVSIIDELPPGRLPVQTFYATEETAYKKTIEEIKKGSQVYIVYPLIDESDKLELKSAVEEADKLSKGIFKDFKTGLLHGRMKRDEKNEIMQKFKNKDFDILISTTVIEVGIDIPNAAVMIIQNADRFGLSALHQLRGRIGRGKIKSFCYLIGDAKSAAARTRIKIMTSTNDGFKIAEADLQMRGPGEFMGTEQHGFPEFKAGNLIKDMDIIEASKKAAQEIVESDANLEEPAYSSLRKIIESRFSKKLKLIEVG